MAAHGFAVAPAMETPTLFVFRGFIPELSGVDVDASTSFFQTPVPARLLASAGNVTRVRRTLLFLTMAVVGSSALVTVAS